MYGLIDCARELSMRSVKNMFVLYLMSLPRKMKNSFCHSQACHSHDMREEDDCIMMMSFICFLLIGCSFVYEIILNIPFRGLGLKTKSSRQVFIQCKSALRSPIYTILPYYCLVHLLSSSSHAPARERISDYHLASIIMAFLLAHALVPDEMNSREHMRENQPRDEMKMSTRKRFNDVYSYSTYR